MRVAYSSLNPVDVKIPESFLGFLISKPGRLASDYAGTVVRSNMTKVKDGDRVFGAMPFPNFGTLAEYIVVVGTDAVNKIPDGLSLADAATLGVAGLTAYQCIVPFAKSGTCVLINGASGSCGTYQIQIAKQLGCIVTAVCSAANADLCRNLGADEIIDYRSTNVVQELKRHDGSDDTKLDLICDNIFVDIDLYWQSHHYLNKTGKFTTIAGRAKLDFVRAMLAINFIPTMFGGGKSAFKLITCEPNAAEFTDLTSWIAAGKVRPVIEETFELNQTAQAYGKLKTGRTRGKIVVKVGDA